MLRQTVNFVAASGVVLMSGLSAAQAQVGEPEGTFTITIKQGGMTIASDTVTIGAGGELEDLKASFQDGDPEDFTQIGTIGMSASPIILKVTTDGDPSFRISHWYIDVPASLANIDVPGPTSLFDPMGGDIDVIVSSFEFDNGNVAMPFVQGNDTFYTSFMRDVSGHFYKSPNVNPYNYQGNGVIDVQVPGQIYTDGTPASYDFEVIQSGSHVSWAWKNILNPGASTKVINQFGSELNPVSPGYVFELGAAVAFLPIPEPSTLLLIVPALLTFGRRRRRCAAR